MSNCGIRAGSARALVAAVLLASGASGARAQGFLDKLSRAATSLRAATIEASLNKVQSTDLEARGLATIPVGGVAFGVAGVESIDTVGLRLHVYLYNAGSQDATVPLPSEGFVLVDGKGRRVESVGGVRWKGLARGATTLTVPGLERVSGTLVFGAPGTDAGTGALKVGGAGAIAGIPLSAAAASAPAAGGSAWTAPGGSGGAAQAPAYAPSYPQATSPQPQASYPQATTPQPPASYPQATTSPQPPAPYAYPQATPGGASVAGTWTAMTTQGPLQLELRADGSYVLGGAVGSYEATAEQVLFRGGPVSAWGNGTAALSGDQLTFRWQNGDGTPAQLTLTRAR